MIFIFIFLLSTHRTSSTKVIPLETYEGQSADGRFVSVIPGGSSIPMDFNNRKDYVQKVIEFRLHEFDIQVILNSFSFNASSLSTHFHNFLFHQQLPLAHVYAFL